MRVLQFLGRDAESDALLFEDQEGNRYAAPLSEALTSAIVRGPSLVGGTTQLRPLTPREIQALLREGMSAEHIAEQHGTDLERIRRFQGPVLAEIARAVSRVRSSRVGAQADAPTLGDLVVDRLAQRGIETEDLRWHAVRRGDGTWEATVVYLEEGVEKSASWSLADRIGSAIALDDAARQLTEVARKTEPIRALFPPVATATLEQPSPASDTLLDRQEQLLKRLNSARGRRQAVMMEIDADDDLDLDQSAHSAQTGTPGLPPSPVTDEGRAESPRVHAAHEEDEAAPAGSAEVTGARASGSPSSSLPGILRPQEPAPDTGALSADGTEPARRRRRTPVPSWDEIVFGSRGD